MFRLEHGKASEQAEEDDSEAVGATDIKSSGSALGAARAVDAVGVDGGEAGGSGGSSLVGLVDARRVLGTASVLLGALGLAGVVVSGAGLLALRHPLGADEVGHGQRELGDVGLLVVAAQAAVVEGFLATILV